MIHFAATFCIVLAATKNIGPGLMIICGTGAKRPWYWSESTRLVLGYQIKSKLITPQFDNIQ